MLKLELLIFKESSTCFKSMDVNNFIINPRTYFKEFRKRLIRWRRTISAVGNDVLCECCLWEGIFFFNGECPKCQSLPRTRLIPFSIGYFNLHKVELKILHVAPNKTEYSGAINKLGNVARYDKLDIRPIKHVNIVGDLTNLSIENNIYDLVIIWHVFEHIVEDTKAISEVYRVLKKQGHLLMSVPIYPINSPTTFEDRSIKRSNYKEIHGHHDHCRSCGLDYYKRFEKFGFKTQTLKVENLTDEEILKFGLSKNHVVWCFTK